MRNAKACIFLYKVFVICFVDQFFNYSRYVLPGTLVYCPRTLVKVKTATGLKSVAVFYKNVLEKLYCEQSEQQGSAKQVLIFSVITKNKVINVFLRAKRIRKHQMSLFEVIRTTRLSMFSYERSELENIRCPYCKTTKLSMFSYERSELENIRCPYIIFPLVLLMEKFGILLQTCQLKN